MVPGDQLILELIALRREKKVWKMQGKAFVREKPGGRGGDYGQHFRRKRDAGRGGDLMSTHNIHPTAIIGPQTELGENVIIGPYAIIEGEAFIDSGTQIGAHVYIDRYTRIGKNCRISPFASIGTPPQDIKYQGGKNPGRYWRWKRHSRICHYQPRNFRRRGFKPP